METGNQLWSSLTNVNHLANAIIYGETAYRIGVDPAVPDVVSEVGVVDNELVEITPGQGLLNQISDLDSVPGPQGPNGGSGIVGTPFLYGTSGNMENNDYYRYLYTNGSDTFLNGPVLQDAESMFNRYGSIGRQVYTPLTMQQIDEIFAEVFAEVAASQRRNNEDLEPLRTMMSDESRRRFDESMREHLEMITGKKKEKTLSFDDYLTDLIAKQSDTNKDKAA